MTEALISEAGLHPVSETSSFSRIHYRVSDENSALEIKKGEFTDVTPPFIVRLQMFSVPESDMLSSAMTEQSAASIKP